MKAHCIAISSKLIVCLMIIGATIYFDSGISFAGIGVDPPVTEIEVTRNQEKEGAFTVVNGDKQPVTLKVEPEDWLKIRTGNSPLAPDEWLIIDRNEFTLEPLETRKIAYRVNVAKDIKGELVAQVFFAGAAPTGGTLNISSRFGVALYVGIEGTEVIEPVIKEIQPDKKVITVTVENRGNIHIRPFGKIIVRDANGSVTQEVSVPYSAVIFGGKLNVYTVIMDEKKFLPGKYTVEADFNTGTIYGNSKLFGKTVTFYCK